ncbi:hypothetical protein HYH03_011433 [Edaphochlamys debaryana]|uniref:Large ribosomal subunit protein bL21m n=1 Tax=Edaphochlamys debaryana TaxID=47281 RepID=A0A835XS09_9CHLO|nr:hypothetical protein HYH03_011433 [Edaphochlamys debaryana]|eukprot:KAG2490127.1 hypothetical protein HYH03_011433 [Edaphochlamys debaryana]
MRTLVSREPGAVSQLNDALSTSCSEASGEPQHSSAWLGSGILDGTIRGVRWVNQKSKGEERSRKPFNTAASWQAVQPLIAEQRRAREQLADASTQNPSPSSSSPAPRGRRFRPRLGPIVDTCLPPIPAVPKPAEYTRVGVLTGQYSLPTERTFAIIELAGTQYKVTTDDIVFVNMLPGVNVNDVLALDRVMLLGSRSETIVGRPYVPGATVLAAVEEHFRDGKVHVFKMKKRKRYRKYQGPRPNLTTLRILQVRGIDPAPGDSLAITPELPLQLLDTRRAAELAALLPPPSEGEEQEEQRTAVGAAA